MSASEMHPLADMVIGVTSSLIANASLSALLEEAGAEVESFPSIRLTATSDHRSLDELAERLARAQWLVISSSNALDFLLKQMHIAKLDRTRLSRLKIASVGPKTTQALKAKGLNPDIEPSSASGADLAREIIKQAPSGSVLWPRSARGKPEPVALLRDAGITTHELTTYDTVPDMVSAGRLAATLSQAALDALTFMSPSAVESVCMGLGGDTTKLLSSCALFSIGPTTSEAMREHDLEIAGQAQPHTGEGLLDVITKWWSARVMDSLSLGFALLLGVLCVALAPQASALSLSDDYLENIDEIEAEREARPPLMLMEPIPVTTFHPMRENLLDPIPLSAEIPFYSDWPVGVKMARTLSYASVFLQEFDLQDDTQLLHDYEVTRLNTMLLVSPHDRWAFGLEASLYHFSSGFLDSVLTDYHDLLGVPNGGRGRRPHNEFGNIAYDKSEHLIYRGEQGGIHMGNLNVFAMFGLFSDHWPGKGRWLRGWGSPPDRVDISLRAGVKIPMGSKGAGLYSGHVDYSVGLLASFRDEEIAFHINTDLIFPGGYSFKGSDEWGTRDVAWKSMMSVNYEVIDRFVAILQGAYNSPILIASPRMNSAKSGVVTLTLAGELMLSGVAFRAGVTEDLTENGEADFVAFLSVTVNF